jgi:hypothetical protein
LSADGQQVQAATAKSLTIPKRWPLVNTLNSRSSNFLKDARLVNAYAEKDVVTGDYQVEKRPGFALTPVVPAGPGSTGAFAPGNGGGGLYSYTQFFTRTGQVSTILYLQGIQGNLYNAYVITENTGGAPSAPTLIGTVSLGVTNGGFTTPAYNTYPTKAQFTGLPFGTNPGPTAAGTIVFSGGGAGTIFPSPPVPVGLAYYYDSTTATLNTLTPGVNGFPASTVPGFVFLDGFTYVMDINGTIWETATQNQIANWGALAFITAETDADIGVQLARQLIYIVAIKQWTTQFFYDAGNTTGSSLSPVPGAQYSFGCVSSDTFQDLDGVLFWATLSKVGTSRIVMIENLNASFVSTPAVERQLDLGPQSQFYSFAYQHAGHRWYGITNVTTNVTMVYDIGEKLWYLWTDYQGNYYPVIGRTSTLFGKQWNQIGATGAIYQVDSDYVYTNDMGNIVPVDIYTPNFDAGVDRIKYLSQMRFNADQTAGSQLWVRFSEDDYGSWNNFRRVDLQRQRPFLNDEGSFYRRAYHFRHYANTPLRIRSVDLQMDIGTL